MESQVGSMMEREREEREEVEMVVVELLKMRSQFYLFFLFFFQKTLIEEILFSNEILDIK